MKKYLRSLLVVSSLFALAACGSKKPADPTPEPPTPEPPAPEPDNHEIEFKFSGYYSETDYTAKAHYNDDLFLSVKSDIIDIKLAEQSLAFALAAGDNAEEQDYSHSDANLKFYFQQTGFERVYISPTFNQKPSKTSLGYGIASKVLSNGETLIAASIRASNYGAEWANNFVVGSTGDHQGFSTWASTIKADLVNYASENNINLANAKMWISGYSRGAGIVNLLGAYLDDAISASTITLKKDNLFVYTFEAPQIAAINDNNATYTNIINFVSKNDLITYFAPNCYGLTLNGQKYEYQDKVTDEELLAQWQKLDATKEALPTFHTKAMKEDDTSDERKDWTASQFFEYFINTALVSSDGESVDVATREHFVENLQPHIEYIFDLVFSMNELQLAGLLAFFQQQMGNIWALIPIIMNDHDDLFNMVKDGLDSVGYQYDETELHTACDGVQAIIYGYYVRNPDMMFFLKDVMTVVGNTDYIIFQHCQETVYSYLEVLYAKAN